MKDKIFKITNYLSLFIFLWSTVWSDDKPFLIVNKGRSVPLVVDSKDAEVVTIAATALAGDVELITGVRPEFQQGVQPNTSEAILIGTLGQSTLIDQLAKEGKLKIDRLQGQWETFILKVIDEPMAGMKQTLVIAGSDPRGTAFGVFELSKRLGVSPWVWWADVLPAKQEELVFSNHDVLMGPPSVKFRGIFLNDEDWGLKPWAANKMDTEVKDIGPKTYASIFELMLRLKANFIWPAMHHCTKAFFTYEGNHRMAGKYNIVIGSSHCEPMLRNNVDEWKGPGPWRYDQNKKVVNKYWDERIELVSNKKIDSVITIGMRGVHDSGMPGPSTQEGKISLLNTVITDQRKILSNHFKKDLSEIPQIFCPYKEVLTLYKAGAKIPDDVTLVWVDDNHGYIRKLSNPQEQQRSGGSGIYYHLSYWGEPEDYLWLNSISPTLISYELTKAYEYRSNRLWMINVGDIKPAELETEFAMDLAWDVKQWSPDKSHMYVKFWAARTFGEMFAAEIADIKSDYYRLAASGKPEHIDLIEFSPSEVDQRLKDYQQLARKAELLKERIPTRLQDAYFQLICYPVLGAASINEMHFYAKKGESEKSKEAYDRIQSLTKIYNIEIAQGKWNGMMSSHPRDRKVFNLPKIAKPIVLNMDNFTTKEPMTLKNGLLYGSTEKTCEESDGGEAKIIFDSDNNEKLDLYFLVQAPSNKEDSCFFNFNGNKVVLNNMVTQNKWEWIKAGTFEIKKGKNVLVISQREPNVKIQSIIFGKIIPRQDVSEPMKIISVRELQFDKKQLQIVAGLGISGESLSRLKFDTDSYDMSKANEAPSASLHVQMPKGQRRIKLIFVPTQAIHDGRSLRTAVKINDDPYQVIDVHAEEKTPIWTKNVIRGYSSGEIPFHLIEEGPVTINFALLDPGLAMSEIRIY